MLKDGVGCSHGMEWRHIQCPLRSEDDFSVTLGKPDVKIPRVDTITQLSHNMQGTKFFQYCTCPAGRVTYNFHSSCKRMHLSFKSICNKEHMGEIWLTRVILHKAIDECFGKNYSSFLDFTRNYERMSVIFVPDMWLPTMWHFDKCRLRRACAASFEA